MITTTTYIILSIIALFGGIIIGALVAFNYASKEIEKIEKKCDASVKNYKDIANTAIRSASKYESRCRELEVKYGEPHVE